MVFTEEKVEIPQENKVQQVKPIVSSQNLGEVRQDSKRVWGTILRKIRLKSMTLFAICSERITEIKGDTLCIYADGETDFMLLNKQDNLSKIQESTLEVENLKVKICEKSTEYVLEEQLEKDTEEVKKIFGEKAKVNKED